MATYSKENDRPCRWQYKISGIEIELKEKQFMNDELEYYKELKTKLKKNADAESKKCQIFTVKCGQNRSRC